MAANTRGFRGSPRGNSIPKDNEITHQIRRTSHHRYLVENAKIMISSSVWIACTERDPTERGFCVPFGLHLVRANGRFYIASWQKTMAGLDHRWGQQRDYLPDRPAHGSIWLRSRQSVLHSALFLQHAHLAQIAEFSPVCCYFADNFP